MFSFPSLIRSVHLCRGSSDLSWNFLDLTVPSGNPCDAQDLGVSEFEDLSMDLILPSEMKLHV